MVVIASPPPRRGAGGARAPTARAGAAPVAGPGERPLERVVVAAVDSLRVPALGGEPRVEATGPVVRRGVIVDRDRRQAPEAEPAGELHGLPVAALVELGVADEAHDPARALLRVERERGP